MIKIDSTLTPQKLMPGIERMWHVSGEKLSRLRSRWREKDGSPVFTVAGKYAARGWTEWTQGFQFGSELLQFAATGDEAAFAAGRDGTLRLMPSHVSHIGVHDHGFNNVSTYGMLRQLVLAGRASEAQDLGVCELALKLSGAIQAARWTELPEALGYIYSFNGPHSLFADTIRSLRALALSHQLGHALLAERDRRVSLLRRICQHAATTARYTVYYGRGRDAYDIRGRVAHESIFNVNDGSYRCPSSQQGYSPFTTWTRGLAWVICGYAEQLEFLKLRAASEFGGAREKQRVLDVCVEAARATADFYLENTPVDGVPYWDTGAPGLVRLGAYLDRPADPFNEEEPVDSSAAAIAAQGLVRLGRYLMATKGGAPAPRTSADFKAGKRYLTAGLTVLQTLVQPPYLSERTDHEGLLLHSVYHRPNGWDYIAPGRKVPCGEACMWGDYHLRELAWYVQCLARGEDYTFFGPAGSDVAGLRRGRPRSADPGYKKDRAAKRPRPHRSRQRARRP